MQAHAFRNAQPHIYIKYLYAYIYAYIYIYIYVYGYAYSHLHIVSFTHMCTHACSLYGAAYTARMLRLKALHMCQ